tara:strand:- start:383 stop:1450 length:1068 start_codon:yes stop_codon:yes gene_type:complete
MSVGNDLQEMEVGTVQSKTAVNSAAKGGDPMATVPPSAVPGQAIEDLGGPTPENYRPDDDSAKLKEPRLAHVSNVVNAKAAKADAAQSVTMTPEETTPEEEVISEEETTEEVVAETPEYNVEEDMTALFSGEELTEEFQEKAKTIFEAAINSKVATLAEEMEKKNEVRIVEEIETVKAALVERVDSYLEYVADEWLQENEIAVEHGLKSEMTESFLSGMKDLFEAHYVSIPEDKYDVVENMVNKLDEMETKLNEQIERNVSLNQRLAESTADGIVSEVAEGLALSQKEKLAQLAESVEFESEESYREKLATLKESYFGQSVQKETSEQVLTEETASPDYSGSMAAYMSILDRVKK